MNVIHSTVMLAAHYTGNAAITAVDTSALHPEVEYCPEGVAMAKDQGNLKGMSCLPLKCQGK